MWDLRCSGELRSGVLPPSSSAVPRLQTLVAASCSWGFPAVSPWTRRSSSRFHGATFAPIADWLSQFEANHLTKALRDSATGVIWKAFLPLFRIGSRLTSVLFSLMCLSVMRRSAFTIGTELGAAVHDHAGGGPGDVEWFKREPISWCDLVFAEAERLGAECLARVTDNSEDLIAVLTLLVGDLGWVLRRKRAPRRDADTRTDLPPCDGGQPREHVPGHDVRDSGLRGISSNT